jgi:tyrosine-protein phosphatase MSG5
LAGTTNSSFNLVNRLIYQLLDYEKTLRGESGSDSEDSGKEDEEWIRKRRELDEASSPEDGDEEDMQRSVIMQEARALDKAMEDRIIARKSSTSSINSTGSGIGMGSAWRSQYRSRKRTGSIASSRTSTSILSEDLVEEEEEEELLGIGGGFDSGRERHSSLESNGAEESSPDDDAEEGQEIKFYAPLTAKATSYTVPEPLPSAPVWKSSFSIPPPPLTAVRSTFNLPPPPGLKSKKKRPMSLSVLSPIPPSPIVVEQDEPAPAPAPIASPPSKPQPLPTLAARRRTESGKPVPPPLALRNSVLRRASSVVDTSSALPTPSQTLFLFPPSPTMNTRTPSTMTLTTEVAGPVPFPALSTPKVSTFRQKGGRTKSFIGLRSPPTPTVGFSKVDARGFFGMQ